MIKRAHHVKGRDRRQAGACGRRQDQRLVWLSCPRQTRWKPA